MNVATMTKPPTPVAMPMLRFSNPIYNIRRIAYIRNVEEAKKNQVKEHFDNWSKHSIVL